MKRLAAVLAAAALAGCGSTVPVGSAGTVSAGQQLGQPTTAAGTPSGIASLPGTTSSAPGVTAAVPSSQTGTSRTAVTPTSAAARPSTTAVLPPAATKGGSIELGFMTTKVGNAQSAGLNVGQTYPDKDVYEALVADYNSHGGLAGKKVVPVYGDTDTASSNWSVEFQAACQHLTQDHKVKAVLGYVFVFLDTFEQCLAKKSIPHLYGGYGPGDVQAQRDFPGIVSLAHPTVDGTHKTVFDGAIATGRLTTRSKLGILYDGCSHGDRAFTATAVPALKAQGIHYEAVYAACSEGSSDLQPTVTAVQSAQLQFAAHGVDVVYVPNTIALLLFMENAESQGYRPAYINQGGGGALEAQGAIPQAQLKNLHGYGWTPAIDVGPTHQPYAPTPSQAACLAKLKRHGLTPTAYNDFMFAYVTCDAFEEYGQALALTGGRTGAADIQQALKQVIPQLHLTTTYAGTQVVSARQRGGPGTYRETGWNDGCSCITYRGPVRTVPGT